MSKNLVLRREEIVRNVFSLTPKHLKLDATVWAGGGGGRGAASMLLTTETKRQAKPVLFVCYAVLVDKEMTIQIHSKLEN